MGRLKDGVEAEEEWAEREEKDAIGAPAAALLARWLVAPFCEVVGPLWVLCCSAWEGEGGGRWVANGMVWFIRWVVSIFPIG